MEKEMKQNLWSKACGITVPPWLIEHQHGLQSRKYLDDDSRMALVFSCAELNVQLTQGAPLAAAVFLHDGHLLSVGVDAPGIAGHEMSNALILASNLMGTNEFRHSSHWDLFSLAPPCLVCLGNIFSERPHRLVCAVSHSDLLAALQLPNTPMPPKNWAKLLSNRGIVVQTLAARKQGCQVLNEHN